MGRADLVGGERLRIVGVRTELHASHPSLVTEMRVSSLTRRMALKSPALDRPTGPTSSLDRALQA